MEAPTPLRFRVMSRARRIILLLGVVGIAVASTPPSARAKDEGNPAPVKVASVPNDEYPKPFRDAVQKAISRGVAWLRTQQTPDGLFDGYERDEYPVGETALAVFTMLQSGVPPDDPAVASGLRVLRRTTPATTYETGLCCLAIGAIADATGDPFAEDEVDAKGKLLVRAAARERLTDDDRKALLRWVGFLRKHQSASFGSQLGSVADGWPSSGGWGYGKSISLPPRRGGRPGGVTVPEPVVLEFADASNTQYALLGLKAAARCGTDVPADVWRRALAYVVSCQSPKGSEAVLRGNEIVGSRRLEWVVPVNSRGFGYGPGGGRATGSMTAAGVAGVLLCRSELEDSRVLPPEVERTSAEAVRGGLAWLQQKFSVTRNPGDETSGATGWFLYYLYGLERAGSLSRSRFLGAHDWYLEGAKKLLADQRRDGSFDVQTVDTCFALLFLRRATVRISTRVITPTDPPAADGAAPVPSPKASPAEPAMGAVPSSR